MVQVQVLKQLVDVEYKTEKLTIRIIEPRTRLYIVPGLTITDPK